MKKIKWYDYLLTIPATLLLLPVMGVIALWIKMDSPGPVFFRQKRIGIHKTHFEILKFRTMRTDTPKDMPTHLLQDPEQYITRSGKFLRKTSLDEIPQLFNILKGDMSIVGPRPALWNQDDLIAERDRYGANDVQPGLTGWAQIHGRDTISIEEKAKLDGYYVEHQGLWMDIRCIFLTVISVLRHDGVQEGGTGALEAEEKNPDKEENNEPLVSVVIATYRREKELRKALSSLALQTWKNMEIILVDDNADPVWNQKVEKILRNWEKKIQRPLTYIKNEENLGSAASRNRGVQAAKGNYITFLDDDDWYLSEKVEHQVQQMMRENADYSISDLALYRENGKLEEKRTRSYLKTGDTKEQLLVYHLLYHMTGTDTLMFRKSYFDKIGGFPPIDVGDEFYLMMQAIQGDGKFSYLAECHVNALVHSSTEGLSSRDSKIQGENQLYEFKKGYFAELKKQEQRAVTMRHHLVLCYAYLRAGNYGKFFIEGCLSVLSAPIACLQYVLMRK